METRTGTGGGVGEEGVGQKVEGGGEKAGQRGGDAEGGQLAECCRYINQER